MKKAVNRALRSSVETDPRQKKFSSGVTEGFGNKVKLTTKKSLRVSLVSWDSLGFALRTWHLI